MSSLVSIDTRLASKSVMTKNSSKEKNQFVKDNQTNLLLENIVMATKVKRSSVRANQALIRGCHRIMLTSVKLTKRCDTVMD